MLRFDEIELLPETEELLCGMVEAALAAKPAGRLFIFSAHMRGNVLISTGPPRRDWADIDEAALQDLAAYGLLQRGFSSKGTPNYRVSNDGYRYYRYLQARRGTHLEQLEETIRAHLDGARFSSRYPRTAGGMSQAFDLLWQGDTDNTRVSELGADLRGAMQDFATELLARQRVESETSAEKPVQRLEEAIAQLENRLGEREPAVLAALVNLADATLRQVQRVHHVRDEGAIDQWDELRRAAFVLAFLMYEFDLAVG